MKEVTQNQQNKSFWGSKLELVEGKVELCVDLKF